MTRIIHRQATVECAPAKAFEMFADSKLVASWLGDRADIELEVGGKYEVFWDYEVDTEGTMGCRVTGIEPAKLISFDWKGPSQFESTMNVADPLTHVVVLFLPLDEETTEVHLIHSGWGSSPEWEEARQWFVRAWGLAFEQLVKLAARTPALA